MKNQPLNRKSQETRETIDYSVAAEISHREVSASYDGMLGLLVMAAFTVVGFRFLYLKSPLHLDQVKPIKPNLLPRLAQPNCKKCRFYRRDSDFQCAVHPVRVNFAAAQTCPDYWQRDRRKFLHR